MEKRRLTMHFTYTGGSSTRGRARLEQLLTMQHVHPEWHLSVCRYTRRLLSANCNPEGLVVLFTLTAGGREGVSDPEASRWPSRACGSDKESDLFAQEFFGHTRNCIYPWCVGQKSRQRFSPRAHRSQLLLVVARAFPWDFARSALPGAGVGRCMVAFRARTARKGRAVFLCAVSGKV